MLTPKLQSLLMVAGLGSAALTELHNKRMDSSDDNRRSIDLVLHENVARMEVIITHLYDLIEAHMKREEEERAELIEKINELSIAHKILSDKHEIFHGEYAKQKMFVAGIVAAVSTMWVIAFGLFEFSKHFFGK